MAVDKLVDSTQLDADLTSVANAIRTKGGTSASLAFPSGFVSAVEDIPSGGVGWTLIGEKTIALEEWTDTVNVDNVDTGINIASTDYAWVLVFVTCDSAITTSTEWGMTVTVLGRYTSNSNLCITSAGQQKGSSTLSFSAMTTNTMSTNAYGVWVGNNASSVILGRKAHGSACPKVRGGNYSIKVYGLTDI